MFDQKKQRFEEQSKQQVPVELLVRNGFDQQLLNDIADDEAESGDVEPRRESTPIPA